MLSAPRKWIVFALIFLGIVVSYIDRGNLSLATQPILRDFHLNPEDMGVLLSAFFWTYALFQLPAGYLIDRFGIRTVYAAAFTLWSLASASIAISRGPGDIIASRLLLGFAESVGPLASLAFIRSHYLPQERGLPTALYIGGQTLGPAFGTLLGVSVMAHYGWRALFAFTGLAAVIWVPAWLAASPRVPSRSITNSKLALSFLLARRDVWAIAGAIFFSSYFWWFVMNWMPGYLTLSRGFSTSDMGTTFSIPLFAMTVTNLISGWLADRIISKSGHDHKIRMALAIIGLILASFLLLLNNPSFPVLQVLTVSICGFGLASSNLWTIAQKMIATPLVGRFLAYLNTLSQLAGAAAPFITGITLGSGSNFRVAIFLAGVAPIMAAVSLFSMPIGLSPDQNR